MEILETSPRLLNSWIFIISRFESGFSSSTKGWTLLLCSLLFSHFEIFALCLRSIAVHNENRWMVWRWLLLNGVSSISNTSTPQTTTGNVREVNQSRKSERCDAENVKCSLVTKFETSLWCTTVSCSATLVTTYRTNIVRMLISQHDKLSRNDRGSDDTIIINRRRGETIEEIFEISTGEVAAFGWIGP